MSPLPFAAIPFRCPATTEDDTRFAGNIPALSEFRLVPPSRSRGDATWFSSRV
jgi:hypothetical protein